MKNPMRIAAIALLAIIAVSVVAVCISTFEPSPEAPSTEPVTAAMDPGVLYRQAARVVANATDMTLRIFTSTKISVGGESFSEKSVQVLSCNGIGTESMRAIMDETLYIGDYSVFNTESYADNTAYITVGEGSFCTAMTADAYLDRYAPAVLLNADLYSSITAVYDSGSVVITFARPFTIETWAAEEGCTLINAGGAAILNKDKVLTECNYSVTYSLGDATIEKSYSVKIDLTAVSVDTPDAEDHIRIQDLNAPLMLERACGYLMQARSVTANISDSIICEAFGDDRSQTTQISILGKESDFMARLDISTVLVNSSRGGETTQKNEIMVFHDGAYRITIDGGEPNVNSSVTAKDVQSTCHSLLIGTVLLPGYISDATVTDTGSTYRFDFTTTEDFADVMCRNACNTLYADPELLHTLASSSSTNALGAYLEIRKETGLPTASGIFYSGTYTIDGNPYLLRYQTDQLYDITSSTAYNNITGQTN